MDQSNKSDEAANESKEDDSSEGDSTKDDSAKADTNTSQALDPADAEAIQDLKDQLTSKLREAEIELSINRAKLSQQKAKLDQMQTDIERREKALEQRQGEKPNENRRKRLLDRWLPNKKKE